jgi:hypothetical protein
MNTDYEREIITFRERAEATLRAADGWLSVVGLFWLRAGDNTIGAGTPFDIALPAGSASGSIGRIAYDGEQARFLVAPGAAVLFNGEPASDERGSEGYVLRSDASGIPDQITLGSVTLFLIQRGERLGVRVRDSDSPARRLFGGRRWYPIRPEYRLDAQFTPYDPPRSVIITNILGDSEPMTVAGVASFTLGEEELHLEAMARSGGLWFIVRDATSGTTTYPAARFLYTPAPEDGRVILDFNRAVSPPCAFTEYATCPLPPPQNRVTVAIEAGELYE